MRPPLLVPQNCSSALVRALALDGFSPLALPGVAAWFHPARNVKSDGAILLANASNQYLTIADQPDWTIGAGFTAAGWFLRNSTGNQYFAGKYASTQREWMIYTSASNAITARLSSDGSGTQTTFLTTFTPATTGIWYFIALRYDAAAVGAELILNMNAAAKQTAAHAGGVFNGTSNLRLGASDFSLVTSFDGRLDSWGFWNRALADAEIADLYNAAAGRTYESLAAAAKTGLIAWYDLAEAAGTRANRHQNSHHAAPTGTPLAAVGLAEHAAADEETVAAWTGQIAMVGPAAQATATLRPKLETGLAHPMLSFDGTDDLFALTAPYASTTGYCVAWVSAPGASFGAILGNSGDAAVQLRQASATQTIASDGTTTITFTHASQSGPAVHLVNGDAATADHYLGGGAASATSGGSLAAFTLDRIAARAGGTPNYFQGELGHIVYARKSKRRRT